MNETVNGDVTTSNLDVEVTKATKTRKGKGKGKTGPTAATRSKAHAAARAVLSSHRYTATAVVLSSGLNAYSSVEGAGALGTAGMIAAAGIGALIPVLVWQLGCVTAWTFRAGWRRLAMVSGAIACCVLALSVVHVAGALAALTGMSWALAGLLAVGIDCGLVSSEATAILVSSTD